jgi:hypothetical protein
MVDNSNSNLYAEASLKNGVIPGAIKNDMDEWKPIFDLRKFDYKTALDGIVVRWQGPPSPAIQKAMDDLKKKMMKAKKPNLGRIE